MTQIQPVILAGGTGSRLWPLSRELYPKQLLNLVEDKSLLQATLERVCKLQNILPPIVVVGEEHRFITHSQIEKMALDRKVHVLLEPVGKNTAPAICSAAVYAGKISEAEDPVLLVLPADHLIRKQDAFDDAVQKAASIALKGNLVTFGITPQGPETGYGYIEKGSDDIVASFVEKPDKETAEKYLESGKYFWNSGMFAFSVSSFLSECEVYTPEILSCMKAAVAEGGTDGPFFRLNKEHMQKCPSDSIDYALMEKSNKVCVVPADLDWSDIGSWQALWDVSEKDSARNVVIGDVLLEDVEGCLVRGQERLVAAVGLKDAMIIETSDAILVAPRDRAQDVKKIVTKLKEQERVEYKLHTTVYRPWGSYTILEEQEQFKIKRITVSPNVKLSLQMHHHRSEHWVVVKGTARVTCGDNVFLVMENQSTYIPCGEKHRLENPGVIPLELIEVQNGTYLGEDDIIRFDDDFGR